VLTKKPLTAHGFYDATRDPEQIERWWRRWPSANVAIRTEGLFVLDLDPGSEGWLSPDEEYTLAGVPCQSTPRGGRHYLFSQDPGAGWRNTTGDTPGGLHPDVDTRADGGYVLVEPSVVEWSEEGESGQVGTRRGAYRWLP
jgi:hypothetical protein